MEVCQEMRTDVDVRKVTVMFSGETGKEPGRRTREFHFQISKNGIRTHYQTDTSDYEIHLHQLHQLFLLNSTSPCVEHNALGLFIHYII